MTNTPITSGLIHGLKAILVLTITSLLCFLPVLFIGLVKLVPNLGWQTLCVSWVDSIASFWSSINNRYIDRTQQISWEISGLKNLNSNNWYLVIANHQSWLDIVILHRLFNRKIPTLKFFIKDQLKWIPFLGFSWWAMGCPFMKRYSKDYLAKNPHRRDKDLRAIFKSIRLFQHRPASIMNFVEGTRYSQQKSQQQQSPYQHLLRPKAGGIGFVISAMGKQFDSLVDVTIVYPEKDYSLWDFLCKRVKAVKVHIHQLPIPKQFINISLIEDERRQTEFRTWLNAYWLEKDALISKLKMSINVPIPVNEP